MVQKSTLKKRKKKEKTCDFSFGNKIKKRYLLEIGAYDYREGVFLDTFPKKTYIFKTLETARYARDKLDEHYNDVKMYVSHIVEV